MHTDLWVAYPMALEPPLRKTPGEQDFQEGKRREKGSGLKC